MSHIRVTEDEVRMTVSFFLNELDEETGGPAALGSGAMRLIRTPEGLRQEVLIGDNKISIAKLREVQMETHEVQTEIGEEKIETRNYFWATFNPDHFSEEGLTGRIRENGLLIRKEGLPYHITNGMGGPFAYEGKIYAYTLETGPSMTGPIVPFEPGTLINTKHPGMINTRSYPDKGAVYLVLPEGKWQEIPTLIRDYSTTVETRLRQDREEKERHACEAAAKEKEERLLSEVRNRDHYLMNMFAHRPTGKIKARCLPPGPGPCPRLPTPHP